MQHGVDQWKNGPGHQYGQYQRKHCYKNRFAQKLRDDFFALGTDNFSYSYFPGA